jgi:hypothetical protein
MAAPAWADAKRTYFTGTETETIGSFGTWITDGQRLYISGATLLGAEDASDPRVSGQATIGVNAIWDAQTWAGPMWGTFHVVNSDGEWQGHWQGERTFAEGHVYSVIVATAVGHGAYEGLVARWTYTGVDVDQTQQLLFTGFIVEAKGGPGDRPFRVSATRTERLEIHPGVIITPGTMPPYEPAMAMTFDIVEEVGQAAHLGRVRNAGTGMVLPTGEISGCGTATAANGDRLHWVVEGMEDPATGVASVVLHVGGGTGALEAAVGRAGGEVSPMWEPTDDPLVFLSHFSYIAAGTIRY